MTPKEKSEFIIEVLEHGLRNPSDIDYYKTSPFGFSIGTNIMMNGYMVSMDMSIFEGIFSKEIMNIRLYIDHVQKWYQDEIPKMETILKLMRKVSQEYRRYTPSETRSLMNKVLGKY